jgi:hypothetical protein
MNARTTTAWVAGFGIAALTITLAVTLWQDVLRYL